jgi:hypothetical protein
MELILSSQIYANLLIRYIAVDDLTFDRRISRPRSMVPSCIQRQY